MAFHQSEIGSAHRAVGELVRQRVKGIHGSSYDQESRRSLIEPVDHTGTTSLADSVNRELGDLGITSQNAGNQCAFTASGTRVDDLVGSLIDDHKARIFKDHIDWHIRVRGYKAVVRLG